MTKERLLHALTASGLFVTKEGTHLRVTGKNGQSLLLRADYRLSSLLSSARVIKNKTGVTWWEIKKHL